MNKPKHIAIIMDGNGRWAEQQGKSRSAGHKGGVKAVKEIIQACVERDISYLTLFAFSSENWNRPKAEIGSLMELFTNALKNQAKKLQENGVRLQLIGDISKFNKTIQILANKAQTMTPEQTRLTLNIAMNYGGRWDIVEAAKTLAQQVASKELSVDEIDEAHFSTAVATAGMPDPDLFIRTSGEYRISNFLLWQSAYAEFYFTDILWPDFDAEQLDKALESYAQRNRRYGQTAQQIQSN
ncbi:MAG: isoprenyl transferase [Arenicella sp.]